MTGELVYDSRGVQVWHGDCLDVLRTLPDGSIASVVTDPPYGLSDHKPETVVAAVVAWAQGDRERVPDGRGFMGREWDAFVPPPAVWDECLRVLKPGGHLVAFAGSRTYDLMGLSIRMAGFEIRDGLQWLYGSGFPKSLDVGKAIDKAAPRAGMFDAFARHFSEQRIASGLTRNAVAQHFPSKTGALTGCVRNWENGANVPTPAQWAVLAPMLALSDEWLPLIERVGARTAAPGGITVPATDAARKWQGFRTALKPAVEPIVLARKPLAEKTVAANILAHGTGALNVDATRVGTSGGGNVCPGGDLCECSNAIFGVTKHPARPAGEFGRWPTNAIFSHGPECVDGGVCQPGCPVAELDAQSGILTTNAGTYRRKRDDATGERSAYVMDPREGHVTSKGDSGGASRYFPTFRYEPKADSSQRPVVNGQAHSTVKPLDLMYWLVRLVTPPGGTVLDPFAGTGPTLRAARDADCPAIGIERDATYIPLIVKRLESRRRLAAQRVRHSEDDAQFDLLSTEG